MSLSRLAEACAPAQAAWSRSRARAAAASREMHRRMIAAGARAEAAAEICEEVTGLRPGVYVSAATAAAALRELGVECSARTLRRRQAAGTVALGFPRGERPVGLARIFEKDGRAGLRAWARREKAPALVIRGENGVAEYEIIGDHRF